MAKFEAGSFLMRTSVGSQTITLNDSTLTPKVILLWCSESWQSSGVFTSWGAMNIGMSSGSSESHAISTTSRDATNPSASARRISSKVFCFISETGTIRADADLTSFNAGNFVLNWTTHDGFSSRNIMYLVIGGSDIEAKVKIFNGKGSTGIQNITGVGFTPDTVMIAHGDNLTAAVPSNVHAMLGFGIMDTVGQWANWLTGVNNQNPSNTWRYQRTDKVITSCNTLGAVGYEATYDSMAVDGFNLNWSTSAPSNYQFIALCLKGVKTKVSYFNTGTGTGTRAVSGLTFQPEALLICNTSFHSDADGSSSSPAASLNFTMGVADTARQRCASYLDRDNVSPPEVRSKWNNDLFYEQVDASGLNTYLEGIFSNFNIDGWTYNLSKNTYNISGQVPYLALATGNAAPNTPTALTVTSVTTDTTPTFSAAVSDPNTTQQIKARFEIYQSDRTTLVGTVDSTLTAGSHTATAEYASALALGNYSVRAKTIDDGSLESGYTAWVDFSIRQAVAAPDLNLLWKVGVLVGPDLNLLWDVFQSGQKDLGLVWNTYANVYTDLEFLWSLKTPWDTVTNPASTWVKVDD